MPLVLGSPDGRFRGRSLSPRPLAVLWNERRASPLAVHLSNSISFFGFGLGTRLDLELDSCCAFDCRCDSFSVVSKHCLSSAVWCSVAFFGAGWAAPPISAPAAASQLPVFTSSATREPAGRAIRCRPLSLTFEPSCTPRFGCSDCFCFLSLLLKINQSSSCLPVGPLLVSSEA